jgi:hypothetical protein
VRGRAGVTLDGSIRRIFLEHGAVQVEEGAP